MARKYAYVYSATGPRGRKIKRVALTAAPKKLLDKEIFVSDKTYRKVRAKRVPISEVTKKYGKKLGRKKSVEAKVGKYAFDSWSIK